MFLIKHHAHIQKCLCASSSVSMVLGRDSAGWAHKVSGICVLEGSIFPYLSLFFYPTISKIPYWSTILFLPHQHRPCCHRSINPLLRSSPAAAADMAVHHLLRRGISGGSPLHPLRGLLASQVPAAPPLPHSPCGQTTHVLDSLLSVYIPGGAGARAASFELGGRGCGGRAEGRAGGRQAAAQDHLLPSHPGTVFLLVQIPRLPVI